MVKTRAARNAVLWIGVGSMILIGIIIVLAAAGETSKGEPIIENAGALIGVVVSGLGGLLGIILPLLLKAEKTQDAVREQVENSHKKPDGSPLNLRDDLDTKPSREDMSSAFESMRQHVEASVDRMSEQMVNSLLSLDRRLEGQAESTRAVASDIRGVRKDIARLQQGLDKTSEKTDDALRAVSGVIRTVTKHHPEEGQ